MRCVPLELAAEKVCDQSSIPPLIFELPPDQGRLVLEKAQDTPVYTYSAKTTKVLMNLGSLGRINVYCIYPTNIVGTPNVIFYIHGAGWVFGSLHTHEKLVHELAARTNSVVIFPEYSRSPEAKYPTAIEQCYHVLCSLPRIFRRLRLEVNFSTLTVAGDSVIFVIISIIIYNEPILALALQLSHRQPAYQSYHKHTCRLQPQA